MVHTVVSQLQHFLKAKFYALGMRCFAALFWKIWLPPARWMFAWWLRSAKAPHLTRASSRIHILYRFAHGCVDTASGKNGWGGPNAWNHGKGIGIARAWRKAQGSALHRHRARRCTIRGLGAAQGTSYPQNKSFAEIERCAVTPRGVARGNACSVARPMQCNAWIGKRPNPLCFCRWWFPTLSLLHTGGGTADPLQKLVALIDQMMIGGERRNLSNNTAMLRGLAQLFDHTPQSMHMPQPKIILKKRGLRKRGLELYGSCRTDNETRLSEEQAPERSEERQKVGRDSGKKVKIGQRIGKQTSGIHGMSVIDLCNWFFAVSWVKFLDLFFFLSPERWEELFWIAPMRPNAMWKLWRGRAKEDEGRRGNKNNKMTSSWTRKDQQWQKDLERVSRRIRKDQEKEKMRH